MIEMSGEDHHARRVVKIGGYDGFGEHAEGEEGEQSEDGLVTGCNSRNGCAEEGEMQSEDGKGEPRTRAESEQAPQWVLRETAWAGSRVAS